MTDAPAAPPAPESSLVFDEGERRALVDGWLDQARTGSVVEAFERACAAIGQRAALVLGDGMLAPIVRAVVANVAERFPGLRSAEVDARGLRLAHSSGIGEDALAETLVALLGVLGELSGRVLEPALRAIIAPDQRQHVASGVVATKKGRGRSSGATDVEAFPIPSDYGRLAGLYATQRVLSRSHGVEKACDELLPVLTNALPVRAAVLLDTTQDLLSMWTWTAEGVPVGELEAARDHARAVLGYLTPGRQMPSSVVSRGAPLAGGVAEGQEQRAFVTLPLVVRGRVFGAFSIEAAAAIDEEDLLFVSALASQLAVALDRRHDQLELEAARFEAQRATRRLEDLQAIANAALEGASLDESLDAVLRALCEIFAIEAATVLLVNPDKGALSHRSSVGLGDAELALLCGPDVAGKVAAKGEAMFFDDLWELAADAGCEPRVHSVLGAPLRVRDRVAGVLCLASGGVRQFAYDELRLLELAADRIATILDNASLYERALAAIRSRDGLMAIVSHDLKNPLSTIMLGSQMLQSEDPAVLDLVASIERAVGLMRRLIADLRDVSAIEEGRLSIATRPESVSKLVHDAVALIEDSAAKKGLALASELHADDLVVDCDRERLIQVLANLLSNAVKFTTKGRRVIVSSHEGAPGWLSLNVTDEGRGIAEGDLPYVFDHYWQAEETAHLGTGLGLAIAKGIVEAHRGRISVQSRVGEGTTFTIELPLASEMVPCEPPAEERDPVRHRGARVLVAEDEPTARAALIALLEDEGFVVTAAGNGAEALAELEANGTDVLVADVEMPGLRGPELVRLARERLGQVPAILMTGHEGDVVAELGIEARHVSKPLDVAELVKAICEALDGES